MKILKKIIEFIVIDIMVALLLMLLAMVLLFIPGLSETIHWYSIAAAILHDVMEDAFVNEKTLNEIFGDRITRLIKIQSEDKTKKWQERKNHTINMLKQNKDKNVEILILADKLSNLRSIAKDHKILGDNLWSRFNSGKGSQEWYYSSIADNLRQLKNTGEYKEYRQLVKEIFS